MAKLSAFLLIIAALATVSWSVEASGEQEMSWVPVGGRCQGSIADCMADDEFDMDTEINRRILGTAGYISYGALSRDVTPCSKRGASYYNCREGAQAHPYNRGCDQITRCRDKE